MNKTYQIRHLVIDFDDHKITSNGVDIGIDHKAIEVIQLLIKNAGNTVSNDVFMEKIWTNKPSSPEVIPAAIARLRKTFKLAGLSEDLIITVHKVGYRFEPISEESSHPNKQEPDHSNQYKWLIGLMLTALAISLFFNYKANDPLALISNQQLNNSQPAQIIKESLSDVTQIYILRHTEKFDLTSEDPVLSAAGIERAKYWKKVLQHIEFDQVFTTEFKRNIQTAKLISSESSVKPELYYPMSFDVLKFLKLIQGQQVLIIGHSNTIPDMVNRIIGETKYPPMSHENYNILYTVSINSKAP
ncbi:MAG: winged helix-turn-helix domain-containing protein, partial [Marinicella sp.]